MNHTIMIVAQVTQEGWQYGHSRALGVVKQDNSLARDSQAPRQKPQFRLWGQVIPIIGPKIGAEHHNSARSQQSERRRRVLEAWETEKRRFGRRARDTVKHFFHRS